MLTKTQGHRTFAPLLNIALLIAMSLCGVLSARESEGGRERSLLLNGAWEFAIGKGDERAETAEGQGKLNWKPTTLPGPLDNTARDAQREWRIAWVRRTFTLTQEQADALAVLRWNRIHNGAEAFINGQKAGENEPTGPYQVILLPGVLKAGKNQIVLKVRGVNAVRRSASGNPVFPCGFGVEPPAIRDDVWIDFAEDAYMKWALAMPDLANSQVVIRVTPVGLKRIDNLEITAEVSPWPRGADSRPAQVWKSPRSTAASVTPDPDPLGGEFFYVTVPMQGFEAWCTEKQPLYRARVKLLKDGKALDELTFRFGMRDVVVKDGNYKLNGKNLWLRGSNLVFEWDWGDVMTNKEVDYLVTEAREMSMNAFRTHTQPPNRKVSDVCDEHGTMLLAEFLVLFNYQDYKFTPAEWDIWHRNVLTDSAGWMARLWNHPSVILWVLSNESRGDNTWEETVFQDFANRLDPTRTTMRTGTTGTKDNYDVHTCGNITDTAEGQFLATMQHWLKDDDGKRTLTNSEYMNYFGHPRTQWTGVDDLLADALATAQIGAEHTEAMRRVRLDGILPYMYAGWTRTRQEARVREGKLNSAVWKVNYASPLSAAWHSTLSPVLASLDLFNPNYLTGQEVTTDLHLINDAWHDADVRVDLLLTKENPEWIPEAECFGQAVKRWRFDFTIKADTIGKTPVKWQLPDEEGSYWLTARLTGAKERPVLSQRFVRAVHAPVATETLRQRTFVLFGADRAARAFFQSAHLQTQEVTNPETMPPLAPEKHTVVIWDATHVADGVKPLAKQLCDFAERGGRVIVLSTPAWNWRDLCDIKTNHKRFSRVFAVSEGIDPQWLIRWNGLHGLDGAVACGTLDGDIMKQAKPILWARDPKTVVMATVPAATGTGSILFSQLDFRERVNPSGEHYDPIATRLLLRLLERGFLKGD